MIKIYDIENYDPIKTCQLSTCDDIPIICKKCKNLGHAVFHLNPNRKTNTHIEIKIGVNHGHFINYKNTVNPALAEGRNVTCYFDKVMVLIDKYCNVRYIMKNRKHLPKWLRDRLED